MDWQTSWRSRLERASFRGFEFLTDSHEARGGRRLVVHEFPGADEPLVEDLGAKSWDWKLSAYFIGQRYDLERNGFLAKLAEPGADWLNHPWLGPLWVRARDWSVSESNDKGGYCAVAIEFVPGGEQPFSHQVDQVDVAFSRVAQFGEAAQADYAARARPLSASAMTSFVAAVQGKLEVLRTALAFATLPLTWASQVQGLVAGLKGDVGALLALPREYAAAFGGLANALGLGGDAAELSDTDRPRVVARLCAAASSAPALTGAAVLDADLRFSLALESALQASLLVSAAANLALADYRAEADRDAALFSVLETLDALLPSLSDPAFQAALAARAALIDALMAQNLAPATVRDVVRPLPSVVLAHRLEVDEEVFIARNAVRHPLFVWGRVHG